MPCEGIDVHLFQVWPIKLPTRMPPCSYPYTNWMSMPRESWKLLVEDDRASFLDPWISVKQTPPLTTLDYFLYDQEINFYYNEVIIHIIIYLWQQLVYSNTSTISTASPSLLEPTLIVSSTKPGNLAVTQVFMVSHPQALSVLGLHQRTSMGQTFNLHC